MDITIFATVDAWRAWQWAADEEGLHIDRWCNQAITTWVAPGRTREYHPINPRHLSMTGRRITLDRETADALDKARAGDNPTDDNDWLAAALIQQFIDHVQRIGCAVPLADTTQRPSIAETHDIDMTLPTPIWESAHAMQALQPGRTISDVVCDAATALLALPSHQMRSVLTYQWEAAPTTYLRARIPQALMHRIQHAAPECAPAEFMTQATMWHFPR